MVERAAIPERNANHRLLGGRSGLTDRFRDFASLAVAEARTALAIADDDERQLFELLQTANGVGPRLAQAVLAIHPPREVRRAVSTTDVKSLMQVPGIGKKGAERLILELRDRLGAGGQVFSRQQDY